LRINDSEERADRIPVLIEKLNNSGINDHFEITRSYIKETVKRVLGIKDGNIISYNKPLGELGIDSLLGLEIKKNIDSAVGLNLPATLVFNYPTIDKITEYLLIDVLNKKESVDSKIKGKTTSSESGNKIIEDIKGLSDEEAEKILLNKLNTDEFDTLDDNE
jgi:acyl carrier protein